MGLELGVFFHWNGRFACVGHASGKIGGYSSATGKDGFCTNRDMTRDAGLCCDGDEVLDTAASRESALGNDQAMLADDDVVTDLDEVIDFCAFTDDGFAETCAVDRGVGADFHIVSDFDDSDLVDFDMFALGKLIAIAIRADDGSRVNDDVGADDAAFGDGDVGADLAVLADDCIFVDYCVGADFCAITNRGAIHDDRARVDANLVGIELRKIRYDGIGVDAGFELASMIGEVPHDGSEREGGVWDRDQRRAICFEFVTRGDDDRTCLGA